MQTLTLDNPASLASVPMNAWAGARGLDAMRPGDITGFATTMDKAKAARSPHEMARDAAEEFVAMAMIQPVLAQLRETNAAASPFAPGDAERRFGFLLDGEYARRIAKAQDFPLVDAVARDLLRHAIARHNAAQSGAEVDTHG
ncbi:MAG: hypothetical protein EA379_10070 [Phycisphaerales bacterium]|nr:MAG: hypothetical protein EA379_10070 [Phycisphaerales bacterium]